MKKYLPFIVSILGIPVGLLAGWGLGIIVPVIVSKIGSLFGMSDTGLSGSIIWFGSAALVGLLAAIGIFFAWKNNKKMAIPFLISAIIGLLVTNYVILQYASTYVGY